MALKGNVEAFSLAAIFQSINANQHSGTLKVVKGKNKKLIYFTKGEVYLLSEGVKKMRKMGYHLVKNKIVGENDIQEALVEQRKTSKLLGEILKERGLISDNDINKILRNQIEEEIYSVFAWRYATFEFIKDFFPPEFLTPNKDVKKVSFHTNSLLMEAARRMDDWKRIEELIPTEQVIFRRIEEKNLAELKLDSLAEERLSHIDGKKSVADLLAKWQTDRYEGCEFLMQYTLQGAITPITPKELFYQFQETFLSRQFKKCFHFYEFALLTNRELSDQFELKLFTTPEFITSSTNYSFSVENLKDYPLSKMLLTLFDNRVIGTLKIASGVSSKSIFFTGDNIWFTSVGKNSTSTLLDFFFRYWNVPQEIQQQLFEIKFKGESQKSIWEEIAENNIMNEEEIRVVFQEKLHEEFCEMYLWNDISIEFIKNECPEEFAESPEDILKPKNFGMGSPEIHEFLSYWNKIIARIPSKKVIFYLAAKRIEQLVGEGEILFYLDGKTTIEEIYEKVHIPLSKIFRIIYQGIKDILVSPLGIDKIRYEVDNLMHYGHYLETLKFCHAAIALRQEIDYFQQKITYLEQFGYISFDPEDEYKLEGDLASFSLAEILQTLNLNKDTGTLHIFTPERNKELYFCQGEVYMLIEENQGKSAMADMLGLGEKQDFTAPLMNFLTEDNISEAEITRIKEQLLDVFIWEGARFEYTKNYLPPTFWLPQMGTSKLSLDTNNFLVDAIQHIVHWENIRKIVYSLNAIYIFTSPESKMDAINRYPKNPQAIYPIDGRHTIEDVLRISNIRKYDVMDLFYELSKENFIRPLSTSEAQEAANAAMVEGKAEECKKFYTHVQELENRTAQTDLESSSFEPSSSFDTSSFDSTFETS